MSKRILKIVLILSVFITNYANASIDVSLEKQCFGGNSHEFFFTNSSLSPDYKVKVGASIYPYDVSFEVVKKRSEADLVFIENTFEDESARRFSKSSDIKLCKKLSPVGAEVIELSNTEQNPYVSVKISGYVLNRDYRIFIKSKRVSQHQAAAYFAILWKTDRDRFLSLLE